MTKSNWTHQDIPDLKEKIAIVTGANTGLGFEISKYLSLNNATVIMACRSIEKGEKAKKEILKLQPHAKLEVMGLDMASFESIENFASLFKTKYRQLNILGNNAGGVNAERKVTKDGYECTVGVNFLGVFKLTDELFNVLRETPHSRIVNMSSSAERQFKPNYNDFMSENSYEMMKTYALSKVSLLHFTFELDRRLKKNNIDIASIAVHPGGAFTGAVTELRKKWKFRVMLKLASIFNLFQSKEMAVLPFLRAATDLNILGGEYLGPNGKNEGKGYPIKVNPSSLAKDINKSKETWNRAVQATSSFIDLD